MQDFHFYPSKNNFERLANFKHIKKTCMSTCNAGPGTGLELFVTVQIKSV